MPGMSDDAISYQAVPTGVPVLTASGQEIGTLEHVLQIPEEDLFDGLVVATPDGLRFVDADQVGTITATAVHSTVDDAAVASLPAPEGAPVYHVDALQDTGSNLGDRLGRLFGRARWLSDDDQ
jgi:hypothetical protein